MLEESNKRLIDMQAEQLRINQALLATLNRLADKEQGVQAADPSVIDEFEEILKRKLADLNSVDVSSGQSGQQKGANVYTSELIIESGKEYKRQTHPLLFSVVDYLETNEGARAESVRRIAELVTNQTGQTVGKSWAAVAKNYWQSEERLHK